MNIRKEQIFQDTLHDEYKHESFILFIREMLNNVNLVAPNKQLKTYSTFSAAVDYYYHIGNYVSEDQQKVALFSVCLKSDPNLENARSMQRNFVKSLIRDMGYKGALVAFFTSGDTKKWRFSLVRIDYEFSNGKLSEKLTPAKRYSYLVGKDEPCHTAMERLLPIFEDDSVNPSLDRLEEAFSVEAVTNDFFRQYREKYLELKEYLESNQQFVKEANEKGFDSEQFAKKLMGQIVFLYFIQKKGWLGVEAFPKMLTEKIYKNAFFRSGAKPKQIMPYVYKKYSDGNYYLDQKALMNLSEEDETFLSTLIKGNAWGTGPKDFMKRSFDDVVKKQGKNYFDDFLEPLFYTGLNENRGDNAFYPPSHRRIPFLNGGLFEEMDGYDWKNNNFEIPNELFSNEAEKDREADGILDIFNRYNFTMAEDEPMEREVAIDPEMLGKVFENLLDVKDRKSKGAFYTPREIVHYMCQESIINYLASKTNISESDIRKFVLYGEYFKDEDIQKTTDVDGKKVFDKTKKLEIPESIFSFEHNVNRLKEIDDLLANVKVVDPAVGSGAFPLGMLNEIVKARNTLTSYMAIEKNSRQRKDLYIVRNPYRFKRETIRDCIFACDIEPSAVDITKLRLWLSLVIDDQIMEIDDVIMDSSTKPRELPNLDCNIICGNSLLDEFMGEKLITKSSALNNLGEYYQGTLYDESVYQTINEIIALQRKLYDEKDHVEKNSLKRQIQERYDNIILEQLKGTDKAEDNYYQAIQKPSRPFILWQLYFPRVFKENGGFNIVIGNPPYVLLQDMDLEKNEIEIYKKRFSVANYKIDLYHLFIEKSLELSALKGVVSFITPSNFTTNNYCLPLRKFMLSHLKLCDIVFYDDKVFEANVNNLVFVGINLQSDSLNRHKIRISYCSKYENKWLVTNNALSLQESLMKDEYIINNTCVSDNNATLVEKIEYDGTPLKLLAKVNFGMQLRNRKIYPTDVISDITLQTPFHKPCYTGKDISLYRLKYNGLYCYYNQEARCGGCWDNHAQFANPKILIRQIGKYPIAAIDERGYAVLNTAFMISSFNNISAYYLLALINSKLMKFFWLMKFADNRKQFPKIKGTYIEKLPIKRNLQIENKIEMIVKEMLVVDNVSDRLAEIDKLVYSIYNISEEEQLLIEKTCEESD